MTYAKCDTKDKLCNDRDNTCVTMLETLEMSAIHVYMVITSHFHKDYPLKPPKLAFVCCATLHMLKDDIYYMKRKCECHLQYEKNNESDTCQNEYNMKITLIKVK